MDDLSRLAIHTITTKPWPLEEALVKYAEAGVRGVSIWRGTLAGRKPSEAARLASSLGLSVVSIVRGGFFVAVTPEERQRRIEDNVAIIEAAAELGAPHVVLVCGADPRVPLAEARDQIRSGVEALLPAAERAGVRLAVEPLHPMYADARSALNTLRQANDLCERLSHPSLGVAVDVYHLWWDPELEAQIVRCGKLGKIFAFHVCDWRTPTVDFLNDRGLMGEGRIDIPLIRSWVERAGFKGFAEVEIFSERLWERDQDEFLADIVEAFKEHV